MMSEATTVGIAAVAAGVCAAFVSAGKATYRTVTWIADQAIEELQRLEQEMNHTLSIDSIPGDVREEFEQYYAYFKNHSVQNPILNNKHETLTQVYALRNSNLGAFVSTSQWNQLCNAPMNRKSFKNILNQATKSYAQTSAKYVSQSIVEVGSNIGFKQQRVNRYKDGNQYLTLMDEDGRALVARVSESAKGAQIHLDMTGFGDQSCNKFMDSILEELKKKQIHLDQLQRRSHYCREGNLKKKKNQSLNRRAQKRKTSAQDERCRRMHHSLNRMTNNN